jgi:hypothetical protein
MVLNCLWTSLATLSYFLEHSVAAGDEQCYAMKSVVLL